MRHRARFAIAVWLFAIGTIMACRGAQVHSMARTTRIADQRFADEYTDASKECLATSAGWPEYDACMAKWEVAYDAMRGLISTTLALDVARGGDEFRNAGCRWYRAVGVVDSLTPVELPSIKAGLESRWRRRCN